MRFIIISSFLIGVLGVSTLAIAKSPFYVVTDLGPGQFSSGINNRGEVSADGTLYHTAIRSPKSVTTRNRSRISSAAIKGIVRQDLYVLEPRALCAPTTIGQVSQVMCCTCRVTVRGFSSTLKATP
jgi:hypothetical protein